MQLQRESIVTKQGRRELRTVLVEAAWRAVEHYPYWRGMDRHLRALRLAGLRAQSGTPRYSAEVTEQEQHPATHLPQSQQPEQPCSDREFGGEAGYEVGVDSHHEALLAAAVDAQMARRHAHEAEVEPDWRSPDIDLALHDDDR